MLLSVAALVVTASAQEAQKEANQRPVPVPTQPSDEPPDGPKGPHGIPVGPTFTPHHPKDPTPPPHTPTPTPTKRPRPVGAIGVIKAKDLNLTTSQLRESAPKPTGVPIEEKSSTGLK
jgi:hypothetical protein